LATTSKTTHRVSATLNLPAKVPALITYAEGIVTNMTGNASFPNPSPALTIISAAITALQAAETATLARTKGAATTRNERRTDLVALLQQLRTSVQTTADGNAANAPSIIQSAGMAVRKTPARKPRVFSLKAGAVSGTVKIVAPAAARRASYEWQYSVDGGKTWTALPGTLQAKTSVSGLTAGSTVEVKYQALTRTGEGNWSAPISMLVQ